MVEPGYICHTLPVQSSSKPTSAAEWSPVKRQKRWWCPYGESTFFDLRTNHLSGLIYLAFTGFWAGTVQGEWTSSVFQDDSLIMIWTLITSFRWHCHMIWVRNATKWNPPGIPRDHRKFFLCSASFLCLAIRQASQVQSVIFEPYIGFT